MPRSCPCCSIRFVPGADASRAHLDSDGSGLGLAITRAIAQAHGGSVTATSGDGRTCFTLNVSSPWLTAIKLTTISSGCPDSVGVRSLL